MDTFETVPGKNKGSVVLYALSTCVWCKKTKKLLDELGIEYQYIYMDDINSELENVFLEKIKKWNPRCSYPTLVINDSKCIIGFEEEEIREAFADGK